MTRYFHISSTDLGRLVKLKPKPPRNILFDKEGNFPRICVSDTLYNCLLSLSGWTPLNTFDFLECIKKQNNLFESPTIYYTDDIPFLPPNASDFRKTKEMWFLEETDFIRLGYIDLDELTKSRTIVVSNECRIYNSLDCNVPFDSKIKQ